MCIFLSVHDFIFQHIPLSSLREILRQEGYSDRGTKNEVIRLLRKDLKFSIFDFMELLSDEELEGFGEKDDLDYQATQEIM